MLKELDHVWDGIRCVLGGKSYCTFLEWYRSYITVYYVALTQVPVL